MSRLKNKLSLDDQSGEFEESHDNFNQQEKEEDSGHRNNNQDDEEDEFGEFGNGNPDYSNFNTTTQVLHNQHADEAIELSDNFDESIISNGDISSQPTSIPARPSSQLAHNRPSANLPPNISDARNRGASFQTVNNRASFMSSVDYPTEDGEYVLGNNGEFTMKNVNQLDDNENEFEGDNEQILNSYANNNSASNFINQSYNQKQNQNFNQSYDQNYQQQDYNIEVEPDLAQEMFDGVYNPEDYAHLEVSAEINSIFRYITNFQPQDIEIETYLKPFIPEYIPAIGDLDSFIKIPRPDDKPEILGLNVIDEPAAIQSDPTALELYLRLHAKQAHLVPITVRSIENADRNTKKIQAWITNISDISKEKPAPIVNYSKNMPQIEDLLQMWPEEMEQVFNTMQLPDPELEMSATDYAKVCCALLDIPVHENIIESLHMMFTLYSECQRDRYQQV